MSMTVNATSDSQEAGLMQARYRHHLELDDVINPEQATARERFEAVAR